ncbi:MAG: hypothetical protein ACJ0DK_03905 [Planctomycetota bacterium]
MKTFYFKGLLTFLCLLMGQDQADSQQLIPRTLDVNGVTREYTVYLPVNFDPADQLPVLFAFGGGGDTGAIFMQFEGDFRPLADSERFIAVYPEPLLDVNGCLCWNNLGPYSTGIDEVGFADAMIDAMVADYSADPQRMFACGFSLGGSLMWDYACELSDHFAAVGVVAANMWEWSQSACTPAQPIGIVHILGTNDFYAPYNGNQYSIATSVQNSFWAAVNQAQSAPTETSQGGGVTLFQWAEGPGCHTVAHYRIQNGDHGWPAFSQQALWSFFSNYTLAGTGIGPGCAPTNGGFRRGDVNGDGSLNISDAVSALIYLFDGGQVDCESAVDGNDDGSINLADAVSILAYLFSGSGTLPAPFPDCGTDSTADALDCLQYNGC